jgi:hypothetical protein
MWFRQFMSDIFIQIHNNAVCMNFDINCACTEHVVVAYLLLIFIITERIAKLKQ